MRPSANTIFYCLDKKALRFLIFLRLRTLGAGPPVAHRIQAFLHQAVTFLPLPLSVTIFPGKRTSPFRFHVAPVPQAAAPAGHDSRSVQKPRETAFRPATAANHTIPVQHVKIVSTRNEGESGKVKDAYIHTYVSIYTKASVAFLPCYRFAWPSIFFHDGMH